MTEGRSFHACLALLTSHDSPLRKPPTRAWALNDTTTNHSRAPTIFITGPAAVLAALNWGYTLKGTPSHASPALAHHRKFKYQHRRNLIGLSRMRLTLFLVRLYFRLYHQPW